MTHMTVIVLSGKRKPLCRGKQGGDLTLDFGAVSCPDCQDWLWVGREGYLHLNSPAAAAEDRRKRLKG